MNLHNQNQRWPDGQRNFEPYDDRIDQQFYAQPQQRGRGGRGNNRGRGQGRGGYMPQGNTQPSK